MVEKLSQTDLSRWDDNWMRLCNAVSAQEHARATASSTQDPLYLILFDELRLLRAEVLNEMRENNEGDAHCLSKHLPEWYMRTLEVADKTEDLRQRLKLLQHAEKIKRAFIMLQNIPRLRAEKGNEREKLKVIKKFVDEGD